jgi:hypothetical protein
MVSLETGLTNAPADEGVAVMKKPAAVLIVLSLAVLVLALVPAAGLAAKGGGANPDRGGGKPSGGGSGSSATLTLSPNPVASWSAFWGSGCGYTVGTQVNVVVNSPYWNAGFPVAVDTTGCMHFQFWVDGPGTYGVKTMQNLSGNKQTVLASADLTVT